MKHYRILFTVAALALSFLFSGAVLTVTAASKTPPPPPPPIDTRILIKAVDAKAGTITIQYMRSAKAPEHTYALDGLTALTVNNAKGTVDQIKVGMQVRRYVERDDVSLDSIDVGTAAPPPVVPKKK